MKDRTKSTQSRPYLEVLHLRGVDEVHYGRCAVDLHLRLVAARQQPRSGPEAGGGTLTRECARACRGREVSKRRGADGQSIFVPREGRGRKTPVVCFVCTRKGRDLLWVVKNVDEQGKPW